MDKLLQQPRVLYLAHDLLDVAVLKRVRMLQMGGAIVTVTGFRRAAGGINTEDFPSVREFGVTKNGGFVQRIISVLRTTRYISRHDELFFDADIVVARNLEMLAIGASGIRRQAAKPRLVYEVLDVHRLMLGVGPIGMVMRWIERFFLRSVSAIITSSPAYIEHYFKAINPTLLPIHLVENKVLISEDDKRPEPVKRSSALPWIIGWFGIIRCKQSLALLAKLVSDNPGKVKVVIRGRPALDQIPEFQDIIEATPGLEFGGPYTPKDLQEMYQGVHFNWTIDMYEEGLNSTWLLPNRLYEGSHYGALPIAEMEVETGKYLKKLSIGLILAQPLDQSLQTFITSITPENFNAAVIRLSAVSSDHWTSDVRDCNKLVSLLSNLIEQRGGDTNG